MTEIIIPENAFEHKNKKPGLSANYPASTGSSYRENVASARRVSANRPSNNSALLNLNISYTLIYKCYLMHLKGYFTI